MAHRGGEGVMAAAALVSLRPAARADAERLFAWRNDPSIVAWSTSRRSVGWEEHVSWLERALDDPDRLLLVIVADGQDAGQLRLERTGPTAVVSVYLATPFTGRGLGVRAIALGCGQGFERWPIAEVSACVREDNAAGRSAFGKAGFRPAPAGACPPGHVGYVLPRTETGRR
jgi:RimJ/RimL family protein N-acetyltransferase